MSPRASRTSSRAPAPATAAGSPCSRRAGPGRTRPPPAGRTPRGARHRLLAVEIRDPREERLEPAGRLALVDPETGRIVEVDTSRRGLRERFEAAAAKEHAEVARVLRAAGAQHVVL